MRPRGSVERSEDLMTSCRKADGTHLKGDRELYEGSETDENKSWCGWMRERERVGWGTSSEREGEGEREIGGDGVGKSNRE